MYHNSCISAQLAWGKMPRLQLAALVLCVKKA